MLVALVYRSQSRLLPASDQFQDMLEDIRSNAQAYNEANGVTGFLLYDRGYFYQALEGEFSSVAFLFSRILRDERHFDIQLVSHAQISRHEFDTWSMAWSIDFMKELARELSPKFGLLHHYVDKFGTAKPLLRDIIAHIAADMSGGEKREEAPHRSFGAQSLSLEFAPRAAL
jgi:Sensors of blue-light using FAD